VKVIWECGAKTESLMVEADCAKWQLIDQIADRLEDPLGPYALAIRDARGS
jgi:hypothetical protein